MTIQQHNEALVRKAMESFLNADGAEFFGLFDEQSVLIEPEGLPYEGTYKGLESIKTALWQMSNCWQEWDVKPWQVTSGGDYIVVLIDFAATAVATGRRVAFPIAEAWHLRNGKVVSLRPIYGDTALAIAALGTGKPSTNARN